MPHCMYCQTEIADTELTEEHVIPQFLGGDYAPPEFKTEAACKTCNSNLGQFVDAGFGKSFFVAAQLQSSAFALNDPNGITGVQPICLGNSLLSPPSMKPGEVCETWLGPLGEPIYWIRPHDDNLFWYMGGNPRTTKATQTRAYFFWSDRTASDPRTTLLTFNEAFKKRKKVKKILCGTLEGMSLETIGFAEPDELDRERIDYFKAAFTQSPTSHQLLPTHTDCHRRFMAKLAIGISWVLLGEASLQTEYGQTLYRALWPKSEADTPNFRVSDRFAGEEDENLKQITGEKNAVTIMVWKTGNIIALSLNLGCRYVWKAILSFSADAIEVERLALLDGGKVFVLYESLKTCITLNFADYLRHKCGIASHPELIAMAVRAEQNMAARAATMIAKH